MRANLLIEWGRGGEICGIVRRNMNTFLLTRLNNYILSNWELVCENQMFPPYVKVAESEGPFSAVAKPVAVNRASFEKRSPIYR